MKKVLLLFIPIILNSCGNEGNGAKVEDRSGYTGTTTGIPTTPLSELGIRFDGHYKEQVQDVVYLIRFFPNGHAVLINGMQDVANELPAYLRQDAIGDPVMGWYNVPVTVQGDSIFFRTYPEKGEISYRGVVPSTSMVRLLRHSHINGTRSIKEYIFQPDAASRQ